MHPPFPVKGQSTSFVLFEIITAVKCAKDLVGLSLSPTDYLNHIHSTVICRLSIKPASWQSPSVCRCRYNYHLLTTFDQSSQPQFGLDSSGILSSFFTTTTTTMSDTTFEALAFSVVKLEVKTTNNLSKKITFKHTVTVTMQYMTVRWSNRIRNEFIGVRCTN